MNYYPEEFFFDESYRCKLCGQIEETTEDFVGHLIEVHESEVRRSNAVSISGQGRNEYWDVDDITLAEQFDSN